MVLHLASLITFSGDIPSLGSTKHSRWKNINSLSFTELHVCTSNTNCSTFDVRTKGQQNVSIYRGLGSRRNRPPMEKMETRTSHSFQIFPHLKYSGSHRCFSLLLGIKKIRELLESLESVPTPSPAELSNEYEKIIFKLKNHFISMVNPFPHLKYSGSHRCFSLLLGIKKIRELVESLESVPTPSPAELSNEYEKIIFKLKNHFISMVHPDCARSKLKKCVKEKVNRWFSITCVYSLK